MKKNDRKWKHEIAISGEKVKNIYKEFLYEPGKEVKDYFGTEFQYYNKEGKEIYVNAVGVELRLKGMNFYSITYPILYKGQKIAQPSYDYIFENGSTASIFGYNSLEDIDKEVEKLKIYNKLFDTKKGCILALPGKEEMNVKVRKI